jgi:hypothetical protein
MAPVSATWLLDWATKSDHHAPLSETLVPRFREMEANALGGAAVETAVAEKMNWGLEELPVLIRKVLMSTTATAEDEAFRWSLVFDVAVTTVDATVAMYWCPW